MIKSAYFPNQEFKTNKELFSALKKHKDELMSFYEICGNVENQFFQ